MQLLTRNNRPRLTQRHTIIRSNSKRINQGHRTTLTRTRRRQGHRQVLVRTRNDQNIITHRRHNRNNISQVITNLRIRHLTNRTIRFTTHLRRSNSTIIQTRTRHNVRHLMRVRRITITRHNRVTRSRPSTNLIISTRKNNRPLQNHISTSRQSPHNIRSPSFNQNSNRQQSSSHIHITTRQRFIRRLLTHTHITSQLSSRVMTNQSRRFIRTFSSTQNRPIRLTTTRRRHRTIKTTQFRSTNRTKCQRIRLLNNLRRLNTHFNKSRIKTKRHTKSHNNKSTYLPNSILSTNFRNPSQFFGISNIAGFSSLWVVTMHFAAIVIR